jgi:hypothetical protein
MARVRNPKPSARPIYPTSGRIHILFNEFAMRLACLREVVLLKDRLERSQGDVGRVLISPDFHAAANAEPTKKFHRKEWFAMTCYEKDSRLDAQELQVQRYI